MVVSCTSRNRRSSPRSDNRWLHKRHYARTETTRVAIYRTAEVLDALLTARIVCMTPVERQVRLIVLATVGDRLGEIVLRRDERFEANIPSFRKDPFACRVIECYVAEVALRKIWVKSDRWIKSTIFFNKNGKGREKMKKIHRTWNAMT